MGQSMPALGDGAEPSLVIRRGKPRSLTLRKKFYEFYVAPITTFYCFSISYLLFLLFFTYIVLVKTSPYPEPTEIFVATYIFALGVEQLRKVSQTTSFAPVAT